MVLQNLWHRILLLQSRPEIVQIFHYEESVNHKEQFKTKEYEWVSYPVNKYKPTEIYTEVFIGAY